MNFNEILESGLLELYVLGNLSGDELNEVERYIQKFPQLKSEILEIEKALYRYDNLYKTEAPSGSLDKILSQIPESDLPTQQGPKQDNLTNHSSKWRRLSAILTGLLLLSLFFFYSNHKNAQNKYNEQNKILVECENENEELRRKEESYTAILEYDSRKIAIAATEKYPETALIIHSNPVRKKNYLQISNLPALNENQSYQLWSLKGENDPPTPLDVFENQIEGLIQVSYIEGTNAYAITIEPKGGKQSPTLENLIGVFSIRG